MDFSMFQGAKFWLLPNTGALMVLKCPLAYKTSVISTTHTLQVWAQITFQLQ